MKFVIKGLTALFIFILILEVTIIQTKELTIETLYQIFEQQADLVNPFGATIQCMHESGNLKSKLAINGNNLTGMKKGEWTGKTIDMKTWEQDKNGNAFEVVAQFRDFDSVEQFSESYSNLINKSFPNCTTDNFLGYFSGFSKGRLGAWATDVGYFKKLLQMAWQHSPLFFKNPKEKWKAALINASDRKLFVVPEHEEIAFRFIKEVIK